MNKLKVRFMYLSVRFMAKFMLFGAEGIKDDKSISNAKFTDELALLAKDLRDVLDQL